MKKSLFTLFIFLFLINKSFSQIYWTEDFGIGSNCNQTQLATVYSGINGSWTISQTGVNGVNANEWYVSSESSNTGAGSCDLACTSSFDQTLHVGNVSSSPAAFIFCPTGDCGAAYDDTDTTAETSKRIESPIINLSGQTSTEMSFIYTSRGQSSFDFARLWYFDGSIWIADTILPLINGCPPYGLWTYFTVNLPSFADNNPNFKIGFEWKNNGDGIANDPSVSIDNIRIAQSFASINSETEILPFSYVVLDGTVYFNFNENVDHKFELFDLTGKLIAIEEDQSFIGLHSSGMYLISVWVNGSQYVVKLSNP